MRPLLALASFVGGFTGVLALGALAHGHSAHAYASLSATAYVVVAMILWRGKP